MMFLKLGMKGPHTINKCIRHYSSVISKTCVQSALCHSKLNTVSRRNIHGTRSTRQLLPMLSTFGSQLPILKVPNSLLVRNKIHVSGLHTTWICADVLTESNIIGSESQISTEMLTDLSPSDTITAPLTFDTTNVQDVHASGTDVIATPLTFDTTNVQDVLASGSEIAEQTLSSLGLGGYTPIGLIQNALDFSHLSLGLPWWGSIVCITIIFRVFMLPFVIQGQVNAANLSAIQPQMQKAQEKARAAANLQNPILQKMANNELEDLFKKHNVSPAKAMVGQLIQLPLFVSFFIALRKMSNLPVESMKTGGVLWFPDLTAADPYFILPIVTAGTMLLTMEMAESNPQMEKMKNVFRGMCLFVIPFTYHFPTAIFIYWIVANIFSILQSLVLKVPWVRKKVGLPKFKA